MIELTFMKVGTFLAECVSVNEWMCVTEIIEYHSGFYSQCQSFCFLIAKFFQRTETNSKDFWLLL